MKISICIPQYNRIDYLLKSLEMIGSQTYQSIEVVVSDDCSTDDTEQKIRQLQPGYKYPLLYHRNKQNIGYDANYRKCIELATGDYAIVIGNDDSIYKNDSMEFLAHFLQENNYPEIGFCNFVEDSNPGLVISRANTTGIIGSGYQVALKNYSCFSFVGGLIYKKSAFDQFNTSKHDGSIYAQMYLGCLMIASGCRLFSIERPLVVKDLKGDEKLRKSYRDVIAKTWKNYKRVDGGIPSVIHVLISAFRDAGVLTQEIIYKIFRRIYTITYPHWVIDYRSNGAFPEAVGLVSGLKPTRNQNYGLLSSLNRARIFSYYIVYSSLGLTVPVFIYRKMKYKLYKFFKKHG
jgi:glycosyltransferase involved in cell wall biosynthesis